MTGRDAESGRRSTWATWGTWGTSGTWGAASLVAVVTAIAFLPGVRAGFVTWDDDRNFLTNPNFRGLGGQQLRWMWTTFHMGHYVPLSWMTLGLDYLLWGMNPAGYHVTNIVLHVANSVAVYFVARRVLRLAGKASSDERSLTLAAAFAALIFAIHPLRVESVVWVTERRDVLSGLFASLATLCYLRAVDDDRHGGAYWAAVVLFACALLSKATTVTLPVIFVILNIYPVKRFDPASGWWSDAARRVYREMIPFAALAAAGSVMAFVALQRVDQLRPVEKVAVSAYSLAFYVWKTVVPLHLSPLYKMPQVVNPAAAMFVASYLAVATLTIGAWFLRRRWRSVWVAWLAFVVITFPMLGFHQNGPQIAADRYTYHAAPVLAILAAAGAAILARSFGAGVVAACAALLLALGGLTWNQSQIWHDSERMWSRVIAVDSESSVAHTALANLLLARGDLTDAIDHYHRSLAIDPASPEAHDNLGVALSRQGKFAESIEQYQQTLMRRPGDYEAENDLGVAIAHGGDAAGAIDHYRRALAIKPDFADAQVNWGNALVRLNKPDEAVGHYRDAVRLRPNDADAERNWGVALAQQGKLAEAVEHFRRALALKPDDADARAYFGQASADLARRRQPPRR